MNITKNFLWVVICLSTFPVANAGVIQNPEFTSLNSWTTLGRAYASNEWPNRMVDDLTQDFVDAFLRNPFAMNATNAVFIPAGVVEAEFLDNELGLTVPTLATFPNRPGGSAILQKVSVKANDIISFDWQSSFGGGTDYDGIAFVVFDGKLEVLDKFQQTGSPYTPTRSTMGTKSIIAPRDGVFILGFGTLDALPLVNFDAFYTEMIVKNLGITNSNNSTIPEPSSAAVLAIAASFAVSLSRRIRRKL